MRFQHLKKSAPGISLETPSRLGILLILSALILSAGLWTAHEAGQRTDLRMRRELVRQARSIAETISPHDVRTLSFTAEDVNRPEFQRLSSQLGAYAETTGLRSLYTMALRNRNLVFGPESLKPGDPYFSPPGTVFQNPTGKDFDIFSTGEASIQGPENDEYGTFVTASVPVLDPITGEVLMVVGLDQEASVWQREVRRAQWVPFLITLLPLGILLAGYFVLQIRQRMSQVYHKHLRHTEAVACATIMLMLTLTAALLIDDTEKKSREEDFRAIAQIKAARYIDPLKNIHNYLDALVQFFTSSDNISRNEFRSYCNPILASTPIQTCLWVPEVSPADAASFTAKVRKEDLPGFSIRTSKRPDRLDPAQDERLYPVLYVEPFSGHEKKLGYDLYSEPFCRAVITEVMRAGIAEAVSAGLATATEPVNLEKDPDMPPGFFIFNRVVAKQQQGIVGFFMHPATLFESQSRHMAGEMSHISVSLFQLHIGETPRWLACSMKGCCRNCWQPHQPDLHITVPVFAFGKAYSLLIVAEPQWLAAHPLRNGRMALLIGLLLTLLLTTLVATLANRPALLEKQVQQRTKELHESEERLELATAAADIGVWDRDIVNNRLIWNERMYPLYGIRPEEFDGTYSAWKKYVHPDDLQAAYTAVIEAEQGKKEFDTEFRIIKANGETRHIKAFGKVLRANDGRPLRMIGINYDMTDRKQAEQKAKSQLKELNRWYQVTLGREARVLELKREINELLQRKGEPPRYKETADSSQKDAKGAPRI